MRNDYLRDSNQYYGPNVPVASDFGRLDLACQRGVRGDAGGTSTLQGPISVGGQGMTLSSTTTKIEGGVSTAEGGRLHVGTSWPQLSPSRTRSLVVPFRRNAHSVFSKASFSSNPYGVVGSADSNGLWVPIPQRLIHDAVNVVSVTFAFRVGVAHAGVPATLPGFGFVKLDANSVATIIASGSVPTPGSADAWYNHGDPQTFALTLGVTTDTKAHSYLISWTDESGSNALAGNIYHSATLAYNGIADLHFP